MVVVVVEEVDRISRERKTRCDQWQYNYTSAVVTLAFFSHFLQRKSIQVLCLEGFSQLLQVVDSRYPTKMAVFLSRLHPGCGETSETAERVHFFIKHFQVCTVKLGGRSFFLTPP